ncbi:MAG: YqcC family protein [Halopseudomonas sp.]|uniref:YqcC family protein n=1 Tax=Halopseudomonas sp. TaxID=2901191 RepID=UPI00300352C0
MKDLESELRSLGLWSTHPPEPARLDSSAPFCVDTLLFEQWLQWLFIPRMAAVLDQQAGLLAKPRLLPMAEQAFVHLGRRRHSLLSAVAQIDRLAAALPANPKVSGRH